MNIEMAKATTEVERRLPSFVCQLGHGAGKIW